MELKINWTRLTDAIKTIAKNYEWMVKEGLDESADWTFYEYGMEEWYNTRSAYL